MAQSILIVDATLFVNNEQIVYNPNSMTYKEGAGEQSLKPQSIGGGAVLNLFSNNLETNFGMVKFDMAPTVDNITLARKWKKNGNLNVVQFFTDNADGSVKKTFTGAALIEDYEVAFGQDATISIVFHSNPAK